MGGGWRAVGGMGLPSSLDPWVHTHYSSGNSHKRSVTFLVSPASFRSLPSPCLLGGTVLLCFISGTDWISKLQILEIPEAQCWFFGWGSPHAFAICQFVPEVSSLIVQQFGVYGKDQQKDSTVVCCPHLVSLSLCKGTGQLSSAYEVFCPQSNCVPSPKCTVSRKIVSSCGTVGILRPHGLLPGFHPSFPLPNLPGKTSKTSDFVLHCFISVCGSKPLSFSQAVVLGKSFSCDNALVFVCSLLQIRSDSLHWVS